MLTTAQQRTPGERNAPEAPRGRPRGPHRRRLPGQLVLHEVSRENAHEARAGWGMF